jgi:hypothetical protein
MFTETSIQVNQAQGREPQEKGGTPSVREKKGGTAMWHVWGQKDTFALRAFY